MTTKRAAIYGRESKGKTRSVADQVRIGEATVAEQGWVHAGTYRDRTSASRYGTKTRDGWARLRAAVAAGAIDVIVLWESSRGSRTLDDWVALLNTCRERGVALHIVSHDRTYDVRRAVDFKSLATDGVDAGFETDRHSERVVRGVASAAVEGKPHGRIPFGYERVYHPATRKLVEQRPHPVHAVLARSIIERVASREPLVAIVRDLNGQGVPSPNGRRWSSDTVRHLVRNPAYIGQRSHRGMLTPAMWPAILPEPMWRAANAVLDEPGRRTHQPGGLRYLLSYIGTAPCGGRWSIHKSGQRYRCRDDDCVSVARSVADERVILSMLARLSRPDARELFAPDDTASAAARVELARLTAELDDARASFAAPGGISAAALAMKEAAMAPALADAARRAQPPGAPLALLALMDAADFGEEHVRPVWDRLPLPARREVITTLCEAIVLGPPTRPGHRWSTREERLLEAARRITIAWRTD